MGKQIDATVYYCDKCRKSIISTPAIMREAECLSVAHGILPNQENAIASLPFSAGIVVKFIKPELETKVDNYQADSSVADCSMFVSPKTVYYCYDCAEPILQDYVDKCNEINQLFE